MHNFEKKNNRKNKKIIMLVVVQYFAVFGKITKLPYEHLI